MDRLPAPTPDGKAQLTPGRLGPAVPGSHLREDRPPLTLPTGTPSSHVAGATHSPPPHCQPPTQVGTSPSGTHPLPLPLRPHHSYGIFI